MSLVYNNFVIFILVINTNNILYVDRVYSFTMCTYRYRKIAGDVCVNGVSAQFLPPSDCGMF